MKRLGMLLILLSVAAICLGFYDTEYITSNTNSVIRFIGFEAYEGQLVLMADQDDDATDGWELAASTSGTLTIGNDSATAGTFVDKLTIAGSTGNLTLTGDIINENADSLIMSTDDTLQYTSNDQNATLQVLGFETKSAILSLSADEGDDSGDTWTFTVADAGAMTVANDGTATMTINEVVSFGSGRQTADVVVTTGTYAVLAANSGKIHVIPDLAGATSIDLPAEADGLYYEFWYVGAADEAHTHTIDSESDTNFFIGGVAFADTDAGDAADEINAGVYSDGNSNSKLNLVNASAGTVVKLTCDGTNWYVTGTVFSATIPTFADQ